MPLSASAKFLSAYIEHSEYDPVKAREYYLRTRELKGRESGSSEPAPTDRASAMDAHRSKLNTAKNSQIEQIEMLKQGLEEAKQRVMAKLQKKIDEISKKLEADVKARTKDKLNEIPENASPKVKAYLQKQNQAISERMSKDVAKSQAAATKQAQTAQTAYREEVKKLGESVKSVINQVRDEYRQVSEASRQERSAISEQYKKPPKQ